MQVGDAGVTGPVGIVCPMTTHSGTPQSGAPQSGAPHPSMSRTQISGARDIIAAVPALLGFVPHRSLVLICMSESAVGTYVIDTVMRHDLSLPDEARASGGDAQQPVTREMGEVFERFAVLCARNDVRSAFAVIVDDRASSTVAGLRFDPRFRAVAGGLTTELRRLGTSLIQVLLTSRLVSGERWTSVMGPAESGTVDDPATSPVALAYMLEGRTTHESREMLREALTPQDTTFSREVAAHISSARRLDRGSDRLRLESVLGQVTSWAAEPSDRPAVVALTPWRTAEFGVALDSVTVRDSLLAVTLTGFADIAEQLWTVLMRTLPTRERVCPAALLGFSAYARGDGALASLAVDIALDADPGYSLARLLERSLHAGGRPSMIREVALSGYAVAESCGVRLPPPLD